MTPEEAAAAVVAEQFSGELNDRDRAVLGAGIAAARRKFEDEFLGRSARLQEATRMTVRAERKLADELADAGREDAWRQALAEVEAGGHFEVREPGPDGKVLAVVVPVQWYRDRCEDWRRNPI